ncbi:(2Fe-2S)-binding protein [Oceanospirillum sediminis]|uniref:(2Fe-2S)-binding protein n=1 Tax=Oceanospirillum sediminis TaxID=2760088 RepID=A0A839INC7_9GAMM|nr:(2Fe-2S)-binding protein [Oceanospirillum sediminis]MBB1486200.1 (2Fe-2S)-binding protein [Oceanospirillum sediminis]
MPDIVISDKKNEVLFDLASQVSPALTGQSGEGGPELIRAGQDNTLALQRFYHQLQSLHASSGKPYWQTRGWGVLTWQPLYLSFLSLYCLGSVPSSLGKLAQQQKGDMVSGFFLPEGRWYCLKYSGCTVPELIALACQQIRPVIQQLQWEFERISGFSKAKSQRVMADRVLLTLLRLAEASNELNSFVKQTLTQEEQQHWGFTAAPWLHQRLNEKERFIADAILWLKGLELPVEHYLRLKEKPALLAVSSTEMIEPHGPGLYLKRLTCCMHYRREDGDLCANCPRLKKNKAA